MCRERERSNDELEKACIKTVFLDGLLLCSGVDMGGKGCIYVYILLALSLQSLCCNVLFLGFTIFHLFMYIKINK